MALPDPTNPLLPPLKKPSAFPQTDLSGGPVAAAPLDAGDQPPMPPAPITPPAIGLPAAPIAPTGPGAPGMPSAPGTPGPGQYWAPVWGGTAGQVTSSPDATQVGPLAGQPGVTQSGMITDRNTLNGYAGTDAGKAVGLGGVADWVTRAATQGPGTIPGFRGIDQSGNPAYADQIFGTEEYSLAHGGTGDPWLDQAHGGSPGDVSGKPVEKAPSSVSALGTSPNISMSGVGPQMTPAAARTPGAPNDVTPSLPTTPAAATPAAATPSAPPSAPGANLSPINPAADLRSQLITAGPTADRFGIASDRLKTLDQQLSPYFQRDVRDAARNRAAMGQSGSGQLRTNLGDITANYANQRSTAGQNFLQNASEGSIGDAYRNMGQLNEQQQFQAGQQQTAFGQGLQQQQLEEALRNGDFSRAATLLSLGNQGNPSDTALILSQIFGGQAGQAGQGLNSLISGTTARNAANNMNNTSGLQELLQRLLSSGH